MFLQASGKHLPLHITTQQASRLTLMSTAADHNQTLDLDIHAVTRSRYGVLKDVSEISTYANEYISTRCKATCLCSCCLVSDTSADCVGDSSCVVADALLPFSSSYHLTAS